MVCICNKTEDGTFTKEEIVSTVHIWEELGFVRCSWTTNRALAFIVKKGLVDKIEDTEKG
jgi:hypothetical protein